VTGEVELKLDLPVAHAAQVRKLPWLRRMRQGPERCEQLQSVYFDTPDLKLREHRLTLRVRHGGQRLTQTIKTMEASGPFGRGEWEQEVDGDRPVLKLAKGTPLEPLITKKLRRKLKPIFETSIERIRIPIRSGGAELELAIDRGQIRRRDGGDCESVSEIEIEVKRGDRQQLAKVAQRLARSVAVTYDPVSKAERGFALVRHESQKPVRARPIVLDTGMSSADAFKLIGLSCLGHALANERAVRTSDPEGVHQMRIGLRRLRAALSIFRGLLRGPEPQSVKNDLKWLTGQLSPARDADVLLRERVNQLPDHTPVAAEAGTLARTVRAKRSAGLAKAHAAVTSRRYRTLALKTALWLANGAWSRTRNEEIEQRRDRPVTRLAAAVLRQRSKKLANKGRRIGELDPKQRHKLRIASKKLRCAAEFFASLVAHKRKARHKRFGRILKQFQGALGTLNDMEVHKGFARRIARRRLQSNSQPREALAMGFIAGQEQARVESCMAIIDRITSRPLPKFWK
jgi:inorganic triphosphatase YgiF